MEAPERNHETPADDEVIKSRVAVFERTYRGLVAHLHSVAGYVEPSEKLDHRTLNTLLARAYTDIWGTPGDITMICPQIWDGEPGPDTEEMEKEQINRFSHLNMFALVLGQNYLSCDGVQEIKDVMEQLSATLLSTLEEDKKTKPKSQIIYSMGKIVYGGVSAKGWNHSLVRRNLEQMIIQSEAVQLDKETVASPDESAEKKSRL